MIYSEWKEKAAFPITVVKKSQNQTSHQNHKTHKSREMVTIQKFCVTSAKAVKGPFLRLSITRHRNQNELIYIITITITAMS